MKWKKPGRQVEADVTERMDSIDDITAYLDEEEDSVKEIEEQVRRVKKRFRRKVFFISMSLVLAGVCLFLLIHLQMYTSVRTVEIYSTDAVGNSSYRQFADGVLKYGRDGIVFLNTKGEERWNHPYQMKNPVVDICKASSGVVADKGGNDIAVFDKDGLRGEIHTDLPIEKAAVSANGIVSVILRSDNSPKIVCYDAAGNPLAELKTSLSGTGYPLDIAVSEDGTMLLVSYMSVQNGKAAAKINYYDFSEEKETSQEYEVLSEVYEDMLAPAVFFLNGGVSVVAGSDRLLFYEGIDTPKLAETVMLDKEIESVFYSGRYVGLVLKNEGKEGYELCLYNSAGRKIMSEDFSGDYTNIKIDGGQVILYDGKKCTVYTKSGICKFDGEMDNNILEMFPVFGVNKYMVINADGMEVVRFVK